MPEGTRKGGSSGDVGVSVDKTWRNIEPARIQDFRRLAACVSSAWTDVTDSPVKHRNFHPIENFPGINVDKLAAGYDDVGFHLSQCALDQALQLSLRSYHIPFLTHHYLGYQSCGAIKITIESVWP
jgi:hypothetical protein